MMCSAGVLIHAYWRRPGEVQTAGICKLKTHSYVQSTPHLVGCGFRMLKPGGMLARISKPLVAAWKAF